MRGDFTANPIEIKSKKKGKEKALWENYEQLYTKKLHNLEEMYKFLETQNLPRLTHKTWTELKLVKKLDQ